MAAPPRFPLPDPAPSPPLQDRPHLVYRHRAGHGPLDGPEDAQGPRRLPWVYRDEHHRLLAVSVDRYRFAFWNGESVDLLLEPPDHPWEEGTLYRVREIGPLAP